MCYILFKNWKDLKVVVNFLHKNLKINLVDKILNYDYIQKIDDATGETITYGLLVERVEKLSTALHDRGLRKGDVVCLYADKSIVGVITVYAIVSVGAVLTPCRPSHTAGMYIRIT